MIEVRFYETAQGNTPFVDWLEKLDRQTQARLVIAIERLAKGHTNNVKSVGKGVHEVRLTFGPGYRLYYGYENDQLIILLAGGSKQRQSRDIEHAQLRWQDYRRRSVK
jgi:putative addiction module killer protein